MLESLKHLDLQIESILILLITNTTPPEYSLTQTTPISRNLTLTGKRQPLTIAHPQVLRQWLLLVKKIMPTTSTILICYAYYA